MTKIDITLDSLIEGEDPKGSVAKLPFERGLQLLDELVSKVEGGTLPLERSVRAYERGVVLMDHLRALLSGAEEKLKVLSKSS